MTRTAMALLLLALPLAAQETPDEPRPSQEAPAVPDAALRAMDGRAVGVRMRDGSEVAGRLAGFDAATLTVVHAVDGAVLTVPRTDVAGLRELPVVPASATAPAPEHEVAGVAVEKAAPVVDRHFGLHVALGPGTIAADLDYRPFYGFVSGTFGVPMFTDGEIGAVALGAGATFRFSRTSAWQFDLFANVIPMWTGRHYDYDGLGNGTPSLSVQVGIGVGAGFHYTFASGFSIGIKVPLIGLAFGDDMDSMAKRTAWYFWGAAMSLPVVSFGYRF